MIKNIKVYVDLDGVLADFAGAVEQRFGKSMGEMPKGELWGRIKNYNDNTKPWFYSLPKMPDADELWNFLEANFDKIEILSASGSTPKDAPGQKKAWVGENLGWQVKANIVGAAGEKAAFANNKSVLIDDRSPAVDPFIKAGGFAVLHKSAANTIAALKVMMEDWD